MRGRIIKDRLKCCYYCGSTNIVNSKSEDNMDATKRTNRGLYYFAHPYTCRDDDGNFIPAGEEANFQLANIRAAELFNRGYNLYSPISHTHPIHRASPVFLQRHEHELWYQLDNEFIDKTHWSGIILAPGWENSAGCRAEKERIEKRGLAVLLYEDIVWERKSERDGV
jgi:hypothetical protein